MKQAANDAAGSPVVSLWVDHPAIGCGERLFVVTKVGTKWATLLSPASLDKIEVDKREFEKHAKPVASRKALAILKRNVAAAKRHGSRYSAKLVDEAKAVLA